MLVLLGAGFLPPVPVDCRLLRVGGWLSVGMVVVQPYILVSELKRIRPGFL